jgi:hypothetical protein
MSGVFQHHPLDGFLICFTQSLNEMLQRDWVNKGFSKNLVVSGSLFFNNRVYSKSFLCYGNIKLS